MLDTRGGYSPSKGADRPSNGGNLPADGAHLCWEEDEPRILPLPQPRPAAAAPESGQDFGEEPTTVRQSGHYHKEYIQGLAEKWDELIDWERRARSEGDFFLRTLRHHDARKVLDAATGTGFHSVRLLASGFDILSVDGCPEMLARAFANARRYGLMLNTCCADWRRLSQAVEGKFDACLCLGNSFTHLFDERDRRKALAEFYATLAYDGVLIIDQRNYDQILDGHFNCQHQYYYCGTDVVAEPEHVDPGLARFVYRFPDGAVFHLNMFPLRMAYLRRLLYEVGFQRVTTYGDFQQCDGRSEPDFFIHVAEKQCLEEQE